jgi:hypothetical protein
VTVRGRPGMGRRAGALLEPLDELRRQVGDLIGEHLVGAAPGRGVIVTDNDNFPHRPPGMTSARLLRCGFSLNDSRIPPA